MLSQIYNQQAATVIHIDTPQADFDFYIAAAVLLYCAAAWPHYCKTINV